MEWIRKICVFVFLFVSFFYIYCFFAPTINALLRGTGTYTQQLYFAFDGCTAMMFLTRAGIPYYNNLPVEGYTRH